MAAPESEEGDEGLCCDDSVTQVEVGRRLNALSARYNCSSNVGDAHIADRKAR